MTRPLEDLVRQAINGVRDPCSIGRGVPAGVDDMGMVCDVELQPRAGGGVRVRVGMRLTSPGCTFVPYFERELRTRVAAVDGIREVTIVWSRRFDWSDDDMSDELKQRLRRKREAIQRL
jgi:metal-sulfur cluster biosynthetic enzyme